MTNIVQAKYMYNMFTEFFNAFTSLVSKGQGLAAVTDVEAQERITVGINWVDTHSRGCHGCSLYHLELPRLKKMRISENDRLSVYLP